LDKAVIVDTDIASAFAKIKRLDLLLRLFSNHSIFITPRIFEELSVSLDYGYTFPLDVFESFDILYPSEEESKSYKEMLIGNKSLGKGELEAITVCKSRGYVFTSMDFAALQFAVSMNIDVLDLQSILRALWRSGIKSKDEVKMIIREIEEKDNTSIRDAQSIIE
jgi:predicted nucleic acid-binding protein